MHKAPKLTKDVEILLIRAEQEFSISVAEFFEPQDSSLSFHFNCEHPFWLYLDRETGTLYGQAPKTKEDRTFQIFLKISNKLGIIYQEFTINLLCASVIDDGETTLINILSKRKETYISHLYTYIPDLLEYVLTFYQVPELIEKLYFSLEKLAQELNLPLDKDVPYKQFKDIITQLNPEIEAQLRLIADEILLKQQLDNRQLQNLFRQGSQQTGVITIPVWNHLGGVAQYNWSHLKTVLDAAAIEVSKLHDEEYLKKASRISPQMRPKGHPGT